MCVYFFERNNKLSQCCGMFSWFYVYMDGVVRKVYDWSQKGEIKMIERDQRERRVYVNCCLWTIRRWLLC